MKRGQGRTPTIREYMHNLRRLVSECHVNDSLADCVAFVDTRLDPQARAGMSALARERYTEAIRRMHRDNRAFTAKFALHALVAMPDVDHRDHPPKRLGG